MASQMSVEDVMDEDTSYNVLADLDIKLYYFELDWV